MFGLYESLEPEISRKIKEIMYTDICGVDQRLEGSCRTLFGGIMQLGASQGINYLMVESIKIYYENAYPNEEKLQNLLDLWFLHVRPKMEALNGLLGEQLNKNVKDH